MNEDQIAALKWIIAILRKHNVAFQITGWLAAIAYGATRELVDIDIDVSEEGFDAIRTDVEEFTVFGPDRYQDATWDLMLMTLNYHGQLIDITDTLQQRICDKKTGKWLDLKSDISTAIIHNLFGVEVPIIARSDLLFYKNIIARDVDLIDIAQMRPIYPAL